MRARLAAAVVAVLALVTVPACSPGSGPESPEGSLTVTTGSTQGVYYAWATALATQLGKDHPRLTVRVTPSSGSVENLERMTRRTADLALATEDATEHAETPDLVALARVYDDYTHVLVDDASSARTLADLAGRPVATGAPGSGVALVAGRVLAEARIRVSARPLDLVGGIRALEDGTVDAVFWSGGLPTRAVSDLAARRRIRLLPLDDVAEAMRHRYGDAYRPATVPPGRYGLAEPVPTLASPNVLVSSTRLDGRIVDAVLSTMFDRRDAIAAAVPAATALDRRTAVLTGSLPLHPAAVAYYRRTQP